MRPDNPQESKQYERPSRTIFVKRELIENIQMGQKTAELRVAFPSFVSIVPGDRVTFRDGGGESVSVNITHVRRYADLAQVLAEEDMTRIAPGVPSDELQKLAQSLFSREDIERYGLILFEFAREVK